MAAQTSRDVQLLINARLQGKRSFTETTDAIAGLTAEIQKQVQAASRGEASIESLTSNLEELKKAATDLQSAQTLSNSVGGLTERLEKSGAAATKAASDLATFRQSLVGAGEISEAQATRLKRLEERAEKTAATLARVTDEQRKATEAARQAGLGTDLADNDRRIAAAALAVGDAMAQSTTAIRTNAVALRERKAQVEAASRAEQEALTNALAPTREILRRQREDEAKAAADAAAQRRAQQEAEVQAARSFQQQLQQALAPVRQVVTNARDRDATVRMAEDFRRAGQEAAAAAQGYQVLASATSRVGPATTDAASAVRSFLDPLAQQRTSLAGLEAQLQSFAAQIDAIKGPIQGYDLLVRQIGAAQRDIATKADLVDAFSRQVAVVREARSEYGQARAEAIRLGQAMAQAAAPSEELASAQQRAQRALEQAARALRNEVQTAQQLRTALKDAGVESNNLVGQQQRLAQAAQSTAQSATLLGEALNTYGRSNQGNSLFGLSPYAVQNLGYQVNDFFTQIASGTSVLQAAAQQGGQVLQIFPGAFSAIIARAPQVIAAIAGIAVVVGSLNRAFEDAAARRQYEGLLASIPDGARLSAQALVQLQREITRSGISFDDAGKLIREAIERNFDTTRLREFTQYAQNLTLLRPGTNVVENFRLISQALQGNFDDVQKLQQATQVFTAAQLENIRSSLESGRVLDAQKTITEALTRTTAAAEQSMSPWQRAWRDLRNAVSDAYDWLANTAPIRVAKAALDSLGETVSNLAQGFSRLIRGRGPEETIAAIQRGIATLDAEIASGDGGAQGTEQRQRMRAQLVDRLAAAQRALAEANGQVAATGRDVTVSTQAQVGVNNAALAAVRRQIDENGELTDAQIRQRRVREALATATEGNRNIDAATRQEVVRLAEAQAEQEIIERRLTREAERRATQARDGANSARIEAAALRARNAAAAEGASDEAVLRRIEERARQEERGRIAEERRNTASGNRMVNAERETANQISQLIAQAARRDTQTLETRLNGVNEQYERIFRQIDRFRSMGGTSINGVPLADVEAQARQQLETIRNQETMRFYEERITQQVQERQRIFQQIREEQAAGNITGTQAIERIASESERLRTGMQETARAAIAFAEGLRTATPNPRLEAFIAQMRLQGGLGTGTATGGASGGAAQQAAAGQAVRTDMETVNRLLQERNQQVQAFQNLVNTGVISYTEGQARIRAAYEESRPALEGAVNNLQATAESARQVGAITENAFRLAGAQADNFRTQLDYVDPSLQRVRKGFEEGFGQGAMTFFNTLASTIAEVAQGTKTVGEGFEAAGRAALQFAADVLKAIAQAIIQEQALIAVKAISRSLGLFHGGGMVGGSQAIKRSGINPLLFASAPRYHSGSGVLGLRADEQAAVLQKGEEVLSRDDPRNMMNLARRAADKPAGGGEVAIRNVLVTDPDFVPGQMAGARGEQTILTVLKNNKPALKQMLGIR